MNQCTGTLFRKKWINRLQYPAFPSGHRLGYFSLKSQSSVKIQFIVSQIVVTREIDACTRDSERKRSESYHLVAQFERSCQSRLDVDNLFILRPSLTSAAERVDLVLNFRLQKSRVRDRKITVEPKLLLDAAGQRRNFDL